MNKIVRYLIYSQASLLVFLGICYVIMPQVSSSEGGVSNYGVHSSTVVFYTLGAGLNALFIFLAARQLPLKPRRIKLIKYGLYIVAALLLLVMLSTYPYKINDLLGNIHKGIAQMLFFFETFFGLWLLILARKDWLAYVCFGIQLTGSLLALLTVYGNLHLLFIAQLISVTGFGLLLIRSISYLSSKK